MVKDPAKRLGYMGADDILRHEWFGHLDLDALAMDQVESPYIPTKDINAAPQRAIGSFADAGSKVMTRQRQLWCHRFPPVIRNAAPWLPALGCTYSRRIIRIACFENLK